MSTKSWRGLLFLAFSILPCTLPQHVSAKTAGVYEKDWAWTAADTKRGSLLNGEIVLQVCWDIPSTLVIPGSKSVSSWKSEVESHINAYWNEFAAIKIQFSTTNCDLTIGHKDLRYKPGSTEDWAPSAAVGKGAKQFQAQNVASVWLCWTFQNYSPDYIYDVSYSTSNSQLTRTYNAQKHRYVILSQATHEFGHVLGLAHEQNHPDFPSTCQAKLTNGSYTPLGLYDEVSIMNYCNPNYGTNQYTPSCGDIASIRGIYGLHPWQRKNMGCVLECASGLTDDLAKTGASFADCKPLPKTVIGSLAGMSPWLPYQNNTGNSGTGGIPVPPGLSVSKLPVPGYSLTSVAGDKWDLRITLTNTNEVISGGIFVKEVWGIRPPPAGGSFRHPGDMVVKLTGPELNTKTPVTIAVPKAQASAPPLRTPSGLHYAVTGTPKMVTYGNFLGYSAVYYYFSCSDQCTPTGECPCVKTTSTYFHSAGVPGSIEYFNALDANTIIRKKAQAYIPHKKVSGTVVLQPFYMDKFEVTQQDYMDIMREYPFNWPGDVRLPAEGMTAFDAILYCNKRSIQEGLSPVYSYSTPVFGTEGNCSQLPNLVVDKKKSGYRLPTPEEWIHAYRAGTTTDFYWGNSGTADPNLYGWSNQNSGQRTNIVGQKRPNPWGLYDMYGNVDEWTLMEASDYQCALGNDYMDSPGNAAGNPIGSYEYNTCGNPASKWPFIGFRPIRNVTSIVPTLHLLLN